MRRFTILSLMAGITGLAVGMAALHSPSALWANALFTLAVAVLTLAVIAAVYRRGRMRAFWVGFAACGWTYMVLVFAPWLDEHFNARLLTTSVLDILYPHVVAPPPPPAPPTPAPFGMMGGMGGGMGGMMGGMSASNQWERWTTIDRSPSMGRGGVHLQITASASFRRIGHSLFVLVFAVLGGWFARYVYAAGRSDGAVGHE